MTEFYSTYHLLSFFIYNLHVCNVIHRNWVLCHHSEVSKKVIRINIARRYCHLAPARSLSDDKLLNTSYSDRFNTLLQTYEGRQNHISIRNFILMHASLEAWRKRNYKENTVSDRRDIAPLPIVCGYVEYICLPWSELVGVPVA